MIVFAGPRVAFNHLASMQCFEDDQFEGRTAGLKDV